MISGSSVSSTPISSVPNINITTSSKVLTLPLLGAG